MIIGSPIIPAGGGEPVVQPITITENGTYIPPAGVDGYNLVVVGVTAGSPRCDQVVDFDWTTEQTYMAWMDGTPGPRPEPIPPSPLPGPSVSFSSGTDEEIAAMIDAAQAGTINLQNGQNAWQVGDTRAVHLSSWDGGKDRFLDPVSHPAQDLTIAISSFAEYMDCGNVLQFDFTQYPDGLVIMNASNMNVGGYEASELYATVLPAMVQALPQWLRDRLISFPVRASAGNDSSTIVTVSGNKLALRSEVEIFGTTRYSKPGEGAQVEYYRTAANRVKTRASTGNVGHWWERSPGPVAEGRNSAFCMVLSNGAPLYYGARSDIGVTPFGCL